MNLYSANRLSPAGHGAYHQLATSAILTSYLMFGTAINLGDALLALDIRPIILKGHNGK